MSLHFCTHPWEVTDLEDGTLIVLSQRDLHPETVAVLVDDLHALVLESGRPNLYLDLERVHQLASVVMGKMVSLNSRLKAHGGKLVLCNMAGDLHRNLQLARVTDALEVREALEVAR